MNIDSYTLYFTQTLRYRLFTATVLKAAACGGEFGGAIERFDFFSGKHDFEIQ